MAGHPSTLAALNEAGRKDVVACDSSICLIDGDSCRPLYRGYRS